MIDLLATALAALLTMPRRRQEIGATMRNPALIGLAKCVRSSYPRAWLFGTLWLRLQWPILSPVRFARWNSRNSMTRDSESEYRRRLAFTRAFHCFITVLPPAPAPRRRSLSDVTVAVKDCIDVQGIRGTWGSAVMAGRFASEDAAVVALLRRAGAQIVGTTNLHEFAFGGTTQNPHFGFCRNAWDPGRVCGGSSGGSAVAVALGLCDLGIGTDTGASVRLPAALNGVFGLRPTHGAVSSCGVMPVSPPHDTVGFMARDLETLRRAIRSTYRFDANDPFSRQPRLHPPVGKARVRLGVLNELMAAADAGIAAAFRRVLAGMPAADVLVREISSPDFLEVATIVSQVVIADAASFHRTRLKEAPDKIGTLVKERISAGLTMSAIDYARNLRWIEGFRVRVQRLFELHDYLVCPTVPVGPPGIEKIEDGVAATRALTQNCWIAPAAGLPALSVPCGTDDNGLPVGFQLIGPRDADLALLDFAGKHFVDAVPVVDRAAFVASCPEPAANPGKGSDVTFGRPGHAARGWSPARK